MRELTGFGIWIFGSGVLTWFFAWGDSLLVGYFFSTAELGLYRTGAHIASSVYAIAIGPIFPVLYSRLCSFGHAPVEQKKMTERFFLLVLLACVLLGVIVLFVLEPLLSNFLASSWAGLDKVMLSFTVVGTFAYSSMVFVEYYKAIGKPRYDFFLLLVLAPIFFTGYILAAMQSFSIFLHARYLIPLSVGYPTRLTFHYIWLPRLVRDKRV